MSNILSLDFLLTHFFRIIIPHNAILNRVFSFFSLNGNSIVIWIIVIIIVLILEERKNPGLSRKDTKFIFIFLLSFISVTLLVDFPLKNLFQRLRPYTLDMQIITSNFSCPTDYSFPSGHAASAFAAATVLMYFDKKRRWFYLTTAFLISYSRIYLGCHYFFDVVGGAFLGFLFSKLILYLTSKNFNR